jgi:cardiolipin synthase
VTGSEQPISVAGVPQDPDASSVHSAGTGVPADSATAGPGPPLYDTDRALTLPNLLSLSAVGRCPAVLWLILGPQADGLAVSSSQSVAFTDWLDGYLARAWHQTSRLGQMLDPIADRLYILAVLIGLALREIIPWWLVVIVVARDVMIAC